MAMRAVAAVPVFVSQWGGGGTAEWRAGACAARGRRFNCNSVPSLSADSGGFSRRSRRSAAGVVIVRAEQASGVEVTTTSEDVAAGKPEAPAVGTITEVDKDTFWPTVKSAGDRVVVLDMYTQWCGPCKLMLPKVEELAKTMDDVMFLKLDCNKENKPLAKELNIRVVPTFKILKANEIVATVAGAKFNDLVTAIEKARTGE